jgi:hypothetical protein
MKNDEDDASKEFDKNNKTTANKIDEKERLKFAKQILFCVFIAFLGFFIAYAMFPKNPALKDIFEFFKIAGIAIATNVISSYFASTMNR